MTRKLKYIVIGFAIITLSCGESEEPDITLFTFISEEDDIQSIKRLIILTNEEGELVDSVTADGLSKVELLGRENVGQRLTITDVTVNFSNTLLIRTYFNVSENTIILSSGVSTVSIPKMVTLDIESSLENKPLWIGSSSGVLALNPTTDEFPLNIQLRENDLIYVAEADSTAPIYSPKYAVYRDFTSTNILVRSEDLTEMDFQEMQFDFDSDFDRVSIIGRENESSENGYRIDFDFVNSSRFLSAQTGLYFPGNVFEYYMTLMDYKHNNLSCRNIFFGDFPQQVTPFDIGVPSFDGLALITTFDPVVSGPHQVVTSGWSYYDDSKETGAAWRTTGPADGNFQLATIIEVIESIYPNIDMDKLENNSWVLKEYVGSSYDEFISTQFQNRGIPDVVEVREVSLR